MSSWRIDDAEDRFEGLFGFLAAGLARRARQFGSSSPSARVRRSAARVSARAAGGSRRTGWQRFRGSQGLRSRLSQGSRSRSVRPAPSGNCLSRARLRRSYCPISLRMAPSVGVFGSASASVGRAPLSSHGIATGGVGSWGAAFAPASISAARLPISCCSPTAANATRERCRPRSMTTPARSSTGSRRCSPRSAPSRARSPNCCTGRRSRRTRSSNTRAPGPG